MNNTKQVILWYGIYMALTSTIIYAILAAFNPDLIVTIWYFLIAALFIPVVFMALAAKKARAIEGDFPYKRAFVVTLLTGLLGALLGNVIGNLHANVIDPEFGYYIKELQIDKQMVRMEKWVDSEEKLEVIRAEMEEKTHNPGATQYLLQFVFVVVFVVIMALIISIFVKKKTPEQPILE
jgi:flagellar basal body-associated protein FliL